MATNFFREELSLGDKLLYTPGGIEVTVTDLEHCSIGVETDEGEFIEISQDEESEYELLTSSPK